MKKLIVLFLALLPFGLNAQIENQDAKYLAGAVPVNESGFVYFKKHYDVKDKTRAEIYERLYKFVEESVVSGADHLPQARITESDVATGVIVASMEEYLYFKRKAWTMDRVRFYYQLICQVTEGGFDIEMRNIRYIYDDVAQGQTYRAEQWIVDSEALNKAGTKLTRVGGKFRRFTIDRKDAIFRGAARSVGGVRKVTKTIEIEEDAEY